MAGKRGVELVRCFILVLLIFTFVTFALSQDVKNENSCINEITLCPIKLKVSAANFYTSYRFVVTTDKNGKVDKVKQSDKKSALPFFNFDEFAPCIKNWKLEPKESYGVFFFLGTRDFAGQKNFIQISNKKETIKIYLGSFTEDLIDRPVPKKTRKQKNDTTKNF